MDKPRFGATIPSTNTHTHTQSTQAAVYLTGLAVALVVSSCAAVLEKDGNNLLFLPELILEVLPVLLGQVLGGDNISVLVCDLANPSDLDRLIVLVQRKDTGIHG
jgi:hypothetical protein